ncbi:ABC-three component system protein [Enterocloster aldenensis]|uniref:ABC-three component system protein n=3 Tax=Enterocloster aldenensis TaxID=358742 RepID=UPI003513F900
MQDTVFINELQKKYKDNNVIPFIGAGLSIPFNIPDWGELILQCALESGMDDIEGTSFMNIIDINLKRYDYWEAVASIKKYALRSEEDIQSFVVNKIKQCIPKDFSKIENNYCDLAKYNFNTIFTTNYDHLIHEYLVTPFVPVNLKDVSANIQNLLAEKESKRIFHLHGNISDESSIVLSRDKYNELYKNDIYKNLFSIFSGVKTFLFIGFSFNDVFIQNIIKENNQFFKSKHYIILANPKIEERRILKENYNIETISYDPSKSSHQEEIRKLLKLICDFTPEDQHENSDESVIELDDLPSIEEKVNLENNLFCKKLRIEDIGTGKINYSKDCFFTAEQYFRWLKKSGIKDSDVIAEYMLKMSYMQYQRCFTTLFEENKDSEELWKAVHKLLSELDLNKLKKRINDENLPNDINKQGFIHVLADEKTGEREVWWGDKRFEE